MKATTRYLQDQIIKDLTRKMVFVSGPRQVGETTLTRSPASATIALRKASAPRLPSRSCARWC